MIALKKHILILGFMGCGKTTISKQLKKKYGFDLIDLDLYIEEKTGSTINQIFDQEGEGAFRMVETKYLKEIIQRKPSIIGLGGGTPCQSTNSDIIFDKQHISIYLKYDPDILASRLLKDRMKRPLLKDYDTLEKLTTFIQTKLAERSAYYEKADFIIYNETNIDQVLQLIMNYIEYINLIDQ